MRRTTWRLCGCVWVAWLSVAAPSAPSAAQPAATAPAPALSEVQRLRADNLKLRVALLQAQQRELAQAAEALERERLTLEAEFRAVLTPPDGSTFNWQTLSFDSPPPAVPATTGAAAPKSDDK